LNDQILIAFGIWAIVFIFSTTLHEAAHAWAAKLGGDLTAYHGGQVTIDPIPHIRREPIGMVLMPLISFFTLSWMIGWASTPYDPYWANRYPHRSAWMALAGPVSNLILAIFSMIVLKVGLASGFFVFNESASDYFRWFWVTGAEETFWYPLGMLFSAMFTLNLLLFAFNLIPLPPLDGATVILLFFPESMSDRVRDGLNQLGIFGLFIAWMIFYRVGGFFLIWAWRLVL
jgi:Zn-dependent protease